MSDTSIGLSLAITALTISIFNLCGAFDWMPTIDECIDALRAIDDRPFWSFLSDNCLWIFIGLCIFTFIWDISKWRYYCIENNVRVIYVPSMVKNIIYYFDLYRDEVNTQTNKILKILEEKK